MIVELAAGSTQLNVRHVPCVPAFFGLVLMCVPGVPDGLSAWRRMQARHADEPSGTPGTPIKSSAKNAGTPGIPINLFHSMCFSTNAI